MNTKNPDQSPAEAGDRAALLGEPVAWTVDLPGGAYDITREPRIAQQWRDKGETVIALAAPSPQSPGDRTDALYDSAYIAGAKSTQFDYLLNAFEQASQAPKPHLMGYGDKRVALYAYVRELEARAARQSIAAAVVGDQQEVADTMNSPQAGELPALPPLPKLHLYGGEDLDYTAHQMHDYATAYARQAIAGGADESFCDALRQEGYAEGRYDQYEESRELLAWAYRKLEPFSFSKQEDALMLDRIKLLLLGAA